MLEAVYHFSLFLLVPYKAFLDTVVVLIAAYLSKLSENQSAITF